MFSPSIVAVETGSTGAVVDDILAPTTISDTTSNVAACLASRALLFASNSARLISIALFEGGLGLINGIARSSQNRPPGPGWHRGQPCTERHFV